MIPDHLPLYLSTAATLLLAGTFAALAYLLWHGYSLSLYRPD